MCITLNAALRPAFRCHQRRVKQLPGRLLGLAPFTVNQGGTRNRSLPDRPDTTDLPAGLKEDLERLQLKARQSDSGAATSKQQGNAAEPSGMSRVKEAVDQVLIVDFFFILVVLLWLGAGVAEKATLNSSTLLDAWFPLWAVVFQPALGVLMLGAIASGVFGWLRSKAS